MLGRRLGNLPHETLFGRRGFDDPCQSQAIEEEQRDHDGGGSAKKSRASARTEEGTGGAAAKRRAGIGAAAVLNQHQADDAQRQQQRGRQKDGVHVSIFARPGKWPEILRLSGTRRRPDRRRYPAWQTTPMRCPP